MYDQPRPDEHLVSVAQLVSYLDQDPVATKEFAKDPQGFLERIGFEGSALQVHHGEEALEKAQGMLDRAGLDAEDSIMTALPKLSSAAEEVFGDDYRVHLEPFAISFLERPQVLGFRWTITGKITCTWDGWDGCSIGLDW